MIIGGRYRLQYFKQLILKGDLRVLSAIVVLLVSPVFAMGSGAGISHGPGNTILWIALILIAAKLSSLIERIGQPAVLGELGVGVLLGNLSIVGIHVFTPITEDAVIRFLAELGVIILLFQIGLESNLHKMKSVGLSAVMVAVVGVISPFILGTYLVGPWLLPDLPYTAHLFLGAALTATSVGITARVFQDLGKLGTRAAQIVLGAAVIDDILGLIILAVVTAIATSGTVSILQVAIITGQAIGFITASIVLGQLLATHIGKWFSRIHTGVGMKFTLVLTFGLTFAYLAELVGLAPIIGAFAAGLILDPVHFRYFRDPHIVDDVKKAIRNESEELRANVHNVMLPHARRHIEDLIEPLAHFFVPVFFVVTGMTVDLGTLADMNILFLALIITAIAVAGKFISGLVVSGKSKALVGFGMVPRGEVGLIFASIGLGLGIIKNELFSIIVIMVILTTLITPPVLTLLIRRQGRENTE